MIVYPAIDLRRGRVVRLVYGDPLQETVYGDNPEVVANRWKTEGASWLHVVNLDGALGEENAALETLRSLATVGLPIQFGGGLRSLDDAQRAIEAGATRVILGTLVIQQPQLVAEAIQRFGQESITIALDAKDGKVATHGWQQVSEWSPVEIGNRFHSDGAKHILYTDISRDGDLSGVNVEATAQLAQATGLSVIASGGVASLDDISALKAKGNIAGVITGKALYTGNLKLQDALKTAQED
jgi:phosphoribosylformimino-5-aminoimidazole carboxamide ribotide isomerase